MSKHLFLLILALGVSLFTVSAQEKEMTGYSMVTRDGRRLVSYKGADGKDVFELVPIPELLGAEIIQTVSLDRSRKLIYIDNELKHPTDLFNNHRYYGYGFYQFPFAVGNARFFAQLNGPVMEPYKDLTGHSTDAYVGAREWSSVENGQYGVALIQWDSSLMEFGEIHPDKTCYSFGKLPEGKSALYSYVFTDWLQMHNPDGESMNLRFRYAITSYAGTWQDAHIPAVAREVTDPYSTLLEKYIRADALNVQVVTVKADSWVFTGFSVTSETGS